MWNSSRAFRSEAHRVRDGAVPGLLPDQAMDLLTDPAVCGIAAALRPQLEDVEQLAGVDVPVEPDLPGERHGVLRRVLAHGALQPLVEIGRFAHRPVPRIHGAYGLDAGRNVVAVASR